MASSGHGGHVGAQGGPCAWGQEGGSTAPCGVATGALCAGIWGEAGAGLGQTRPWVLGPNLLGALSLGPLDAEPRDKACLWTCDKRHCLSDYAGVPASGFVLTMLVFLRSPLGWLRLRGRRVWPYLFFKDPAVNGDGPATLLSVHVVAQEGVVPAPGPAQVPEVEEERPAGYALQLVPGGRKEAAPEPRVAGSRGRCSPARHSSETLHHWTHLGPSSDPSSGTPPPSAHPPAQKKR